MKHNFSLIMLITIMTGCNSGEKNNQIKPSYRDISEFVYASANVVSQNEYQCRPSRSGIIQEVFIEKGAKVKKGQLLFKISASADMGNRLNNAEVNLKEVKDNLYGANNKLRSIQVEITRLKEQNLLDSIDYQRYKRLWDQDIGTKSELERKLLSYQASSSRLSSLELELRQQRKTLENNYKLAQNQVETERGLRGELEVRSKINGEVFSVLKEVGEYISPQEVFAQLGSVNNFILDLNIDEVDISRISIGDTAIIDLQAYPDRVYTATLSYISNIKDQATQTFLVEAEFVESPEKLFNGLGGEANILVARRENAIVIPSAYLKAGNVVMTNEGEVTVTAGVKNLEFVEIIKGLDTAMILLKPEVE